MRRLWRVRDRLPRNKLDEQHGDVALDHRRRRLASRLYCIRRVEQRDDGDIGDRPKLARESDVGERAYALKRPTLVVRRRRKVRGAGDHADAAGRAACVAAAHGQVGNAEAAARLEHGPTARHFDGPLRIGHGLDEAVLHQR